MGSHLSSDQLSQLAPLLGSLARLVARGSQLSERELRALLLGVALESNAMALEELRRWGTLLHDLRQTPDAIQRQATVEALLLRGIPEAPVLLAVATVADTGTPPTSPPVGGQADSPQPPSAPHATRLHASVTNLDFGILQPGQTTTLEFAVQGGPGHVHVESDHIQVAPMQFGADPTQLRVGVKPLASGLLFTTLKLVTRGETLTLQVTAQWQDGGAVPAQIVLDPLVVSPPPMRQPPKPIVVPQAHPPVVLAPPPTVRHETGTMTGPVVQSPPPKPPAPKSNPPPNKRKPPSTGKRIAVGWLGVLLVVIVVGIFAKMGIDAANQAATATAYALNEAAVPQAATAIAALPAWVPTLVKVPAGSFLMGSNDRDTDAQADEKPQQALDLPTYWIGTTEVTNAQFRPFVEGDGYSNRAYWTDNGWAWRQSNNRTQPTYWDDATWNGADYPVVGVTWYEAVAYCNWLSAKTGMEFRLPTEVEWEKAARGTDGWIYPWGNTWENDRANSDAAKVGRTTPVGSYPSGASPYGALDMAGNVWEWTRSEYKPYPYDPNDGREDTSDPAQKRFTLRGGSWRGQPIVLRASYRYGGAPDFHVNRVGFRVSRYP